MFKFIVILLFFFHIAMADTLWSDIPVKYKEWLVVETHNNGLMFSTYIWDRRFPSLDLRGVLYATNTFLMDHAKVAHESAVVWVLRNHANLKIYVPCNHEEIGIPKPLSAPRGSTLPCIILPPPPSLRRVPTDNQMRRFDWDIIDTQPSVDSSDVVGAKRRRIDEEKE